MGVYVTCLGSGRREKLPGVPGKRNSLLMLHLVEFSIVDTVLKVILCFC